MFNYVTWLAIAGGIVAHTIAAICQKTAAQQQHRRRAVYFFVLGLGFGFFHPLCTAIAMRGNNPNLVIAAKGCLGGVFFILVIKAIFHESMTLRQWVAIFIILVGGVMLQIASLHARKSTAQSLRFSPPPIIRTSAT